MHNTVTSLKNIQFTRKGLELAITLCSFSTVKDWGNPLLRNSFWRCYLATSEGAKLISSSGQILLKPGEVVLIPPFCNVRGSADKPFTLYYAHFNCSLRLKESIPIKSQGHPEILLDLETALAMQDESSFRLQMMKLVSSAIAAIPTEIISPTKENDKIDQAYRIMKEHIGNKLTNNKLAQLLNLSESTLIRLFKTYTGTTPGQEHLRMRLNHAANLLQKSDQSIEFIAETCGFWDRNHFSRAFTKQWDMAPGKYRRTVATL